MWKRARYTARRRPKGRGPCSPRTEAPRVFGDRSAARGAGGSVMNVECKGHSAFCANHSRPQFDDRVQAAATGQEMAARVDLLARLRGRPRREPAEVLLPGDVRVSVRLRAR